MRWLSLLLAAVASCATVPAPSPSPHSSSPRARTGQAPAPEPQSAPAPAAAPLHGNDEPSAGTAAVPPRRSTAESLARFRQGVAAVSFDVTVHPPGSADVAGFVLSRDGKPVSRACVELAGGRRQAPVFTSSQGDFRFAAVPPGPAKVTITVADLESLSSKDIADYHDQDPNLTVLVRALVMIPGPGRLSVARVKRQGGMPGQDGGGVQWIEVAPVALDLDGYTPTCRQALRRQRR